MTLTRKPAALAAALAIIITAGLTGCGSKPKVPLSVACKIPSFHLACPPGGHHGGQPSPDLHHG